MNVSEIPIYLQKNYSIFDKNITISPLNNSKSNNQNFIIFSKKQKFVLHNINEEIKLSQIEKICNILKFCNKYHARVQLPIKNNKGKFANKEFLSYLTKFSKGHQSTGKQNEIKNLAIQLANLHKILSKCPIPYNFRLNHSFYKILKHHEISKIKSLLKKKPKKNDFDNYVLTHLTILAKNISNLSNFDLNENSYSKQLIHFDLHPANVLFQNNDVIAFLDFNSMRKGSIWEDVAFSSFRFALLSKKRNLVNLMNDFFQTYEKHSIHKIDFFSIQYFLFLRILKSISYILKKRYFLNEEIRLEELKKFFNFLSIITNLYDTKNLST